MDKDKYFLKNEFEYQMALKQFSHEEVLELFTLPDKLLQRALAEACIMNLYFVDSRQPKKEEIKEIKKFYSN